MEKLSVWEFKEYWNKTFPQPQKYIFYTGNQEENRAEHTIRAQLEFDQMHVFFNPNTIRLQAGENYLNFEKVKYIKLNEKSMLGEVFTVVCGDFNNNDDKRYTLIAQ